MVYPFVGRLLAHKLDGFRQILGRDAQLLGVPAYTPLFPEILFHQNNKIVENGFCTGPFWCMVLEVVNLVADVVNHGFEQRHDQLTAEKMVALIHFSFDKVEIVHESLYFLFRELEHWKRVGEEEEAGDVVHFLYDFSVEVVRAHDGYTMTVGTQHIVAYHMTVVDDNQIVAVNPVLLGVHTVLCTTLQAERNKKATHASGLSSERNVLKTVEQDQVVVDETRTFVYALGMRNGDVGHGSCCWLGGVENVLVRHMHGGLVFAESYFFLYSVGHYYSGGVWMPLDGGLNHSSVFPTHGYREAAAGTEAAYTTR